MIFGNLFTPPLQVLVNPHFTDGFECNLTTFWGKLLFKISLFLLRLARTVDLNLVQLRFIVLL
jgi:hypothetical protein